MDESTSADICERSGWSHRTLPLHHQGTDTVGQRHNRNTDI